MSAAGPAYRLAELVLSMNMVTEKGLAARALARKVIAQHDDLLHSLHLIVHATKPEPDDGGYHEAAHDLAAGAIATATGAT